MAGIGAHHPGIGAHHAPESLLTFDRNPCSPWSGAVSDETDSCIQFSCLAVGYVLGLRHRNGITDTDVFRAECLLPGSLAKHAGQLGPSEPSAA